MSGARTTTDGEGLILFGGSGFLGPYILEWAPKMIPVGRSKPPVANRHIPVDTLENLDALEGVYFDFYRSLRRTDQVIFRQSLKSVPHFPQEQSA